MTEPRYTAWRLTLIDGAGCILAGSRPRTRAEFAELLPRLFIGHRVRAFAPLETKP